MKKKYFSFALLMLPLLLLAQTDQQRPATFISQATYVIEIPPISSQTLLPPNDEAREVNPKQMSTNTVVIGKGFPKGGDPLWNKEAQYYGGKAPSLTFEAASSGSTPTDPTGAIGPNHFVNAWNSSFAIYDRTGTQLVAPASLATIFPGETLGDPIVLYDNFADRFVITQFSSSPDGFLVAVSQGPDPVNDGWFTYRFNTDTFPDYPKYTIWSDGYYITANKDQGSPTTSEVVFAIERDEMLSGNAGAQIVGFNLPDISNNGFYSPLGFNALGSTLPPTGNAPIIYLQDDAWAGVSEDHLKIWSINVDWDTPANSTISTPQELMTTAFDAVFDGGSFSNLPQPPSDPDIDALQATIMYMAHYRQFGTYNSAVLNFTVDLDGSDDLAGIRWYELRQNNHGDPWTIFQEGTYAQPDGDSAFCGAMGLDNQGNIGLAYTVVSASTFPSLRYTGRLVTDSLNQMTIAEDIVVNGSQSNPSNRYGDYAHLTVDPVDDQTFWYIGEYFAEGARKNQVGVFKVASDAEDDLGIIEIVAPTSGTLSSSEIVTIAVRNFGRNDQSGFSLSYQIDGGTAVTENFVGTIAAGGTVNFSFSTTADLSTEGQTYAITGSVSLTGDENANNDSFTSAVKFIGANDVGVTSLVAPATTDDLVGNTTVSVNVRNFGTASQSNFDVSYSVNSSTVATETFTNTIASGADATFTFATTFDFSSQGQYNFSSSTLLSNDSDTSNDTFSVALEKTLCRPTSNCSTGSGLKSFSLEDIQNTSITCSNGYEDFSDTQNTGLDRSSASPFTVTVQTGITSLDERMTIWIDFNDNGVFESGEEVLTDRGIFPADTDTDFNFSLDSNDALGEHFMRVRAGDETSSGNIGTSCDNLGLGTTHDYKVTITDSTLSLDDLRLIDSELVILYKEGKQFEVSIETPPQEAPLRITIHNMLGQRLLDQNIRYSGGRYVYDLDMSFASAGIYLVRVGNSQSGKVKRIAIN